MKQNIILIILVVIAGILIYGLFNNKKTDDSHYLDIIKSKNETIKAVESEREVFRQWKDDEVRENQKKDSLLQLKDKINIVKYEKIPVYINSLDKNSLRTAGERAVE